MDLVPFQQACVLKSNEKIIETKKELEQPLSVGKILYKFLFMTKCKFIPNDRQMMQILGN